MMIVHIELGEAFLRKDLNRKRHRRATALTNDKHKSATTPIDAFGKLQKRASFRSCFNSQMPEGAPWQLTTDQQLSESNNVTVSSQRRRHRRNTRHRRRHPSDVLVHICSQESNWVVLEHAQDMRGRTVEIVQSIEVDNIPINQYFYETKCAIENIPCDAIDRSKYQSSCKNKYSLVYALVVQESGKQGWTFIRVRSSCNCAVAMKTTRHFLNIITESTS